MQHQHKLIISWFVTAAVVLLGLFSPAQAATISIGPSAGTFTVGSTFDSSIFINTQGESVNAVDIFLYFPPDKLQVVSPSAGQSVVGIWTSPLKYDNQNGSVRFQGGIPGGLNVGQGLISTITFRVRRVGTAIVKLSENSKILLNDGKGTDVLSNVQNGIYSLIFPPPAGPIVTSLTHSDQLKWYNNPSVILLWASDVPVDGYSYVLSDEPLVAPDDISDGTKTSVSYKNLSSGTHYFHIKSLRDGIWGGVTHFAVNIDVNPPAEFSVEVSPATWTTSRQMVISFTTTDSDSGISYYEYAVIPTDYPSVSGSEPRPFFTEVESPQTLNLDLGSYDIVVKAYDNAGNFRDSTVKVRVLSSWLSLFYDKYVLLGLAILVLILGFTAWKIHKWRRGISDKTISHVLPDGVKDKLRQLKEYRNKYGKLAVLLIFIGSAVLFGSLHVRGADLSANPPPQSSQNESLSPPIISTVSRNISNDEIFYVGGKASGPNLGIVIYLQNLSTGETFEQTVISDANGNWFYRHDSFLQSGEYILWAQERFAGNASPPSPQVKITVIPTAFQFGSSRLSYETVYALLSAVLFAIALGLLIVIFVIGRRGNKKKRLLLKEVKEAEDSIRQGFAVLKRDIEAELATVKKARLSKALSAEEKEKETRLLSDLEKVESYIGKEVFDIEKIEL